MKTVKKILNIERNSLGVQNFYRSDYTAERYADNKRVGKRCSCNWLIRYTVFISTKDVTKNESRESA